MLYIYNKPEFDALELFQFFNSISYLSKTAHLNMTFRERFNSKAKSFKILSKNLRFQKC